MIDLERILNQYEQKNFQLQNPRQVKSGKEAVVFAVFFQDKRLALKVYIDPQIRSFKNNQQYVANKYFRSPSEQKAVLKKTKTGQRMLHQGWIRREFYLLQKLYKLGINVPVVYQWTDQSILMEFIGDEEIAPRLIDVELTPDQAKVAYKSILDAIQTMYQAGIVHSDLSAYNILWWKEKPWIIDLPQAIDIRQNPNKDQLLARDLANIKHYFAKYFEIN